MEKALKKKLNSEWSLVDKPKYPWHCFKQNFRDKFQDFKAIPERSKYGVSAQDVWSLDGYLLRAIYNGLIILKEEQNGHPCSMTMEEWDAMLDENIERARICMADPWDTGESLYDRYEFIKATEPDNETVIENARREWSKATTEYAEYQEEVQKELFAWLGEYLKELWW